MKDCKEQRICFKFFFDLEKTAFETYKMLNDVIVMKPRVQYQPPQGIHVYKVAKLWLKILNIHIAVC